MHIMMLSCSELCYIAVVGILLENKYLSLSLSPPPPRSWVLLEVENSPPLVISFARGGKLPSPGREFCLRWKLGDLSIPDSKSDHTTAKADPAPQLAPYVGTCLNSMAQTVWQILRMEMKLIFLKRPKKIGGGGAANFLEWRP